MFVGQHKRKGVTPLLTAFQINWRRKKQISLKIIN